MFGYRVPAPDEAMLISGRGGSPQGAPFRVVIGHGAFVTPVFRKVRYLTLSMQEAEVAETCVTKQGISLNVRSVIAFKVGNDRESIVNAGQRFLSDQDQMSVLTGRIFAGHLRSIIGSMTVEEIVNARQKLATEVLDGSKTEMATIGLTVDSLQIQSIDDMGAGYIAAMAAPNNAAIQRQAKIAQAAADQAAAEAQQASVRKQAEFARQTAVVQAQYKAEIDKAQAAAAQAGPPGPGAAGGHRHAGQAGPAAGRAASAATGLRGDQARRGGGPEGQDPRHRRCGTDQDRGGGRRVEQPGGTRPVADRPAPADRQGGRSRPAGR